MRFFQPFQKAHGMDISDYMIRIAEVSTSKRGIRLQAFNEVPLEAGIVTEGEIKRLEAIEPKIKMLYKGVHGRLSSNFVIIAIPERKTFTKVITIDRLPQDQLQEAVKWEAEQHFPIALEDVYTTWSLVSQNETYQSILLSATDRLYVEQYTNLLESMNKHVVIAEPESAAMQRFLLGEEKTAVIILDLGASKTSADIVVDGVIRYTSTFSFSGKELTFSLSSKLNLREDQAEKAKLLFGLDKSKSKGVVRKILEPHFSQLIDHLKDINEYYKSQFEGLPAIQKILLCGGGARMEGLPEYLNEQLGIPAEIRFPKLIFPKQVHTHFSSEKILSFVTVLGLALRDEEQKPFEMLQ